MSVFTKKTHDGTKPVTFGEMDTFYIPNFLSTATSNQSYYTLLNGNEIKWYLHYFFKDNHSLEPVQRLSNTQYLSDDDNIIPWYRYPINNQQNHPQIPFTKSIKNLSFLVQEYISQPINHSVINLYRNGNDFIPFHSDNPLDIKHKSLIALISLGAHRQYVLKHTTKGVTVTITLNHGSLLVLGPKTNKIWQHSIIKDERVKTPRISITLRYIATYLNLKNKCILGQGHKYQDVNYPLSPFNDHILTNHPDIVRIHFKNIKIATNSATQIVSVHPIINRSSTIHCVYTLNDSHFHGMLFKLDTIQDGREYMEQINKRYKAKGHAPYALVFDECVICGDDEEWDKVNVGSNLMKILKKYALNKVLIVVVRHWMGTYLGLPKLLNAYTMVGETLSAYFCSKRFGADEKFELYKYHENGQDIMRLKRVKNKL